MSEFIANNPVIFCLSLVLPHVFLYFTSHVKNVTSYVFEYFLLGIAFFFMMWILTTFWKEIIVLQVLLILVLLFVPQKPRTVHAE